MARWLLKTEPSEYSWQDLCDEKEGVWNGVRAPAAIKNIRNMQPGDQAFVYHTGKEKAVIGIAQISSAPYHNAATGELVFRVVPEKKLPQPVTLKEIKSDKDLADWELVRLPRLSVVPVSDQQADYILQKGSTPAN